MIGSTPGKLENKPRKVARNTCSRFSVSVITSPVCETDKIDIALSHIASTAVFLLDSRIWIPLRNRSLRFLYRKGINVKIAIVLYAAKLRAKDRKFRDLV